jgi:membrane-associated phospholipid phosphatase
MLMRRLGRNPLVREGALLLGLYWLYSSIRWFIARDSPFEAYENAFRIIHLERQLGIFHELTIQNWLVEHNMGFVHIANAFYTVGYFPIVVLCAVLLYRYAPSYFQAFRLTFLLGLGFALLCFSVFPLAPPRLLPGIGFVDTQLAFGDGLYQQKFVLSFYNPYAAMPSLHFGLAFLVGMIAYSFERRILRILGVAYPSFMALVIVTTGHHYILDIAGGGIAIALAYSLVKALPYVAKEMASSPAAMNGSVQYTGKRSPAGPMRRSGNLPDLSWSNEHREYQRQQNLRSSILASFVNWRPPF